MSEVPTYGVRERDVADDGPAARAQAVRLLGYTVIENVLPAPELLEWRERADAVFRRQATEAGGEEALRALGEENTARALLAYDEAFLRLVQEPTILAVCEHLLGPQFILNQQNAVVLPGAATVHRQGHYHRDLPYQHFVSSRPLAVSALFCLDDFTAESGATVVLPASHRVEAMPAAPVVAAAEVQLCAPAGSVLLFDSMLFHRAGTNRGPSRRRGVNHVWSLPILKQQIALPGLVPDRLAPPGSPLARLLGFESEPPRSVASWLESRRARLAAPSQSARPTASTT